MTPPQKPTGKQSQPPGEGDPARIVTPIDIARARHASTHGGSILEKTRRVSATTPKAPQPPVTPPPVAAQSARQPRPPRMNGINGCLLASLLGIVFLVGGVLGGMVGGGLLLWANNLDGIALWRDPPTPTPVSTPTPAPAATPTQTPTVEPEATPLSTEDIIAQIIPSVVTVINQQHNALNFSTEDGRVVGSGVIVDERGYIATNNHVVENAGDLSIILADGREVRAELVATDPAEDLAILTISLDGLPAIKWGDSAAVRLGQTVFAIGSPLGDFPSSVSFGIVSGLNRALEMDEHVIDGLIQTDAAINRGSSGGPLINSEGQMIGINTFIIRESEDRGVAEGIAFAIPANAAKNLLTPWIAAHRGETVPIPASGEPGD